MGGDAVEGEGEDDGDSGDAFSDDGEVNPDTGFQDDLDDDDDSKYCEDENKSPDGDGPGGKRRGPRTTIKAKQLEVMKAAFKKLFEWRPAGDEYNEVPKHFNTSFINNAKLNQYGDGLKYECMKRNPYIINYIGIQTDRYILCCKSIRSFAVSTVKCPCSLGQE